MIDSLWRRRHQPWVLLWPLALANMTSWGCLYFSFSLLIEPMQHELGWSRTALNGALTCGLLVTGLTAYPVGKWLDRHGGRWLMTLGSLGSGLLLLIWSRIEMLPQFYLMWLTLGVCMACVFMEPLFAVINQVFGTESRKAFTSLILVVGLSGSVYVPLIGNMIPWLGWRETLVILAALQLCFCAPIHWWFIPPRHAKPQARHAISELRGRIVMRRRLRNPVFWGLALWYTSYNLTASSINFQFIPLLRAEGVTDTVIFAAFALIGPVQVCARAVIMTLAKNASIARLGAGTSSVIPVSILVLIFAPHKFTWLCLFVCLFATGHGITTILRGTAPLEWLGREYFARTMGAIALPMMFAMALAPSLTAFYWKVSGSAKFMLWMIFAGSLLGSAGYWLAVLSRRRARRRAH